MVGRLDFGPEMFTAFGRRCLQTIVHQYWVKGEVGGRNAWLICSSCQICWSLRPKSLMLMRWCRSGGLASSKWKRVFSEVSIWTCRGYKWSWKMWMMETNMAIESSTTSEDFHLVVGSWENCCRWRRKLAQNSDSDRCSRNVEDVIHVVRDCKASKEVWDHLLPHYLHSEFFDLGLKD